MTQDTALVPVVEEFQLPTRAYVEQQNKMVAEFQKLVQHHLVQGHDYGKIPGTQKDTLLKPGAEKIAKLIGLADTYEIMGKIADWDKGLFQYEIRCSLVQIRTGTVVAQGVGECNSYEPKYRYRTAQKKCPTCGQEAIIKGKAEYGGGWLCWTKKEGCGVKFNDGDPLIERQPSGKVENPDPAEQINTYLKMAKKRALVDAALSVGALSDLFTQDMEDYRPAQEETPPTPAQQPQQRPAPQQGRRPTSAPAQPPRNPNEAWNPADLLNALEAEPDQWPVIFRILGVENAVNLTKLYPSAERAAEVYQQRQEEAQIMDEAGV